MSILLESRKIFVPLLLQTDTVRLVQLVEHQIVVLGVVGSSPTSHPKLERERFLMSFSFCFSPMRRAALFAPDSSLGQGENLFSGSCGIRRRQCLLISGIRGTRCRQCSSPLCRLWHSVPERASYGTEYAFGAQNRLLGYATHFQRHSV